MTKKQSKKVSAAASKKLVSLKKSPLSPEEQVQYDQWSKNRNEKIEFEKLKAGEPLRMVGHHDAVRTNFKMIKSTGASDLEAANALMKDVSNMKFLDGKKDPDVNGINELLALVAGIKPTDNVEGMLAAQMVAVHTMSMDSARRSMFIGQTFEGRKQNLDSSVKLMRTYTAQMDALNKHRGKGQQKMTVEHVHVNEGGQAIIGNDRQPK